MSFNIDAIPDTEKLVPRAQAARYLACSVSTLERWHWLGTGPKARRIGGRSFYVLAELRSFAGLDQKAA